jgi:hypothetical protein
MNKQKKFAADKTCYFLKFFFKKKYVVFVFFVFFVWFVPVEVPIDLRAGSACRVSHA